MKVLYQCEECKKYYACEKEAQACEANHVAVRKRKEELFAQKERRIEEYREAERTLRGLREEFIRDYDCLPNADSGNLDIFSILRGF